jgi:hypothetical protein
VEFYGLPGVGKSSVAALTRRGLSDLGIASEIADRTVSAEVPGRVRIPRKLGMVGAHGLAHPVRSIRVVGAIGAEQQGASATLSRSVQWLVTQALFARARRRPGVHLFQEGVLQALWSLGLRGGHERMLGRDAAHAIWPDLVVVVEAPMDVVRSRLGSRGSGHSRTERLDEAERAAELTRGQALLHQLLAWWRSVHGPGRVVRVDNGGDGPPDLDELVRTIGSISTR